MEEKDTDKLLHSLKNAKSFKSAISETKPYTVDVEIKNYLNSWLEKKNISKSNVLKNAGITEATGYQYFDGKRKPPREKLVAITIGLDLTLEETNTLFKQIGYAQLYPKHPWDAVIIYGITHHLSIEAIDDLLYEEGLKTFIC
ncbi:helix-turn-helix transcriptional regulator [Enterococcus sp. BWB1-3]|uniref:helix-turn-helix domain-containing protein n=1 Tax=unclassified Enterococcus TaxID=2608891 RepID=UPI001923DB27|nr:MULTISPECIES: helix-turn-helix transcriptional regulator [unclassified Enterococcus]MBL1229483.1 helix-turn-helix transcriptional regulator [Enterococcus sp. BWB1-3]MCB5952657.1 helix-turn-helix transcriptional regulator [Enterococcus sp. BWT-B8]MCB5955846.1 helix-turn-helix transcriptional regulator [Enterococcus sp. CWB-B31]